MKRINVTRSSMPLFEEYCEAIKPLWDTRWLTNMGCFHQELERKLKEYLEIDDISLMVNGHMSLELAIQAFGFPEGSEIITTPFTFISTTHAIIRNHLIPVFCDIKESDGTIDENKIESLITKKTVAIIPVHVFGHICNAYSIKKIADKYGLKVIYDAAHAFGEKYYGRGVANLGDVSVFSFHATKVFNTIEGGAVATNNYKLYEKLNDLKNFGIRDEELIVDIGANAKMNEFSAVMGLCNLKHIDRAIEDRKRVYSIYKEAIDNIIGIRIWDFDHDSTDYNYSYCPMIVDEEYGNTRDELYKIFKRHTIYPRKYFYPIIPDTKCYCRKYSEIDLKIARSISEKVLALPIYEDMGEEETDRVIEVLRTQR